MNSVRAKNIELSWWEPDKPMPMSPCMALQAAREHFGGQVRSLGRVTLYNELERKFQDNEGTPQEPSWTGFDLLFIVLRYAGDVFGTVLFRDEGVGLGFIATRITEPGKESEINVSPWAHKNAELAKLIVKSIAEM